MNPVIQYCEIVKRKKNKYGQKFTSCEQKGMSGLLAVSWIIKASWTSYQSTDHFLY